MVEIKIIDNQAKIETDEIEIYISGDFELKKRSEIKNTPVAGTTDVKIILDGKEIVKSLDVCHNYSLTTRDKLQENQ